MIIPQGAIAVLLNQGDHMERLDLKVSGMSCGHCVAAVTSALKKIEGVAVENVTVGSASVSFDPGIADAQQIRSAIEDAGYEASQ